MNDIKKNIKNAVNDNRNLIISFIKKIVRTPSLANDEASVQHIIPVSYTHLTLPTKRIV